jgi:cell division septal protein FtsQ
VKRALAVLALVLVAAAAGYYFFVRDKTVVAHVQPLSLAATIGEGEDAIPVSANGKVLTWLTLPEDLTLPVLPLDQPPKGKRLKGTMLEQAKVLGAVPTVLRPYLAGSRYGESGVEVELASGIELRFGDASQLDKKWKAAAAVLADPEIEALDYVDLRSPSHPALGGEGHLLPPLP